MHAQAVSLPRLTMQTQVVIGAMKYGKDLVVLMSNCAPPITSQFNSPEEFPLALLDAKQVGTRCLIALCVSRLFNFAASCQ